jgi:ABC-2 type transport system ATP-binding protein
VIAVDGLTKSFAVARPGDGFGGTLRAIFRRETETVTAVDGLSFSVGRGERVGFLGPNGAGKTTTLKVLSGLLVPTAGRVQVAGHTPWERHPDFLSRITLVMGQKQQLRWDLPPTATFELNRALYGLGRAAWAQTRDELIALLELEPLLGRPVRTLSLGERMKCELCAALLHRPDVLFLDEPTIGLDVRMQRAVRGFVARWNESTGATVLLTSHDMADVQALCPRILVIVGGRLRFDGPPRALVQQLAPHKRVRVRSAAPLSDAVKARFSLVEDADGAVAAVAPDALPAFLAALLQAAPVTDLSVEEMPLEEAMRRLLSEGAA